MKRTQTSDTIFSGTWGVPNEHKIYTIGQDSFLIVEGEDGFSGGHRFWFFRVYDINIPGELKCIFETHFTTYKEQWFNDKDYIITEAKTQVDYSSDTITISLNEKYKIPKEGKDPLAQKVLHEDDKELVFLLPKHH